MKKPSSKQNETQPSMLSEKLVLTETEAAEYVGMSRSFLRHARIDGNRVGRTPAPRFIKIGRAVRYPKDELNNFLAQFPRQSNLYEDVKPAKNQGGDHAA